MVERTGRYLIEFKDIPTERQKMPELPAEERASNFSEVELEFSQEQAIAVAVRCLSCRRCIGCALCLAVCHGKGIDFAQADREVELEADSIIIVPGVERIPSHIEEKFGYGKYINVITFPEFERILSESGPYDGLVLRPYDGEIPTKIAFVPVDVQQDINARSCASKAALAAHRKIPGLETHLFFPDVEARQDELQRNLDKEAKISVGGGEVLAISESEGTKNVTVESAKNGKIKKEEFQLVVLLTTYELPDDVKELTRKLGVDLASYRFQDTLDTSLVKTSKEGLSFTGFAFTAEAEKAD